MVKRRNLATSARLFKLSPATNAGEIMALPRWFKYAKPKAVIPAFCDRSQLAALAAAFAPAHVTMDGPVAI